MDTPEKETSDVETPTDTSTTEQSEETATSDTSEDGTQEDADTLKKRLSDKDSYIKKLELKLKAKKEKGDDTEDHDDVMTWFNLNADNLKLVGKEFKEELSFYKSHKIPVTNEIRDRALREARDRKGVRDTEEHTVTASETQGEMRKTAKITNVPESVLQHRPGMTPDQYAKYKAEFDAGKKRG
jgi:hypothetical protein